jgi:tetratricopeptide (TPR) repeat protein
MEALKRKFREGRRAEAIMECEALCRAQPANRELKRLCALMHAAVRHHERALELLVQLRDDGHDDADLLFNIAVCERELERTVEAARAFEAYTSKFPGHADGWAALAECRFQLGQFDQGLTLADRAIQLDARCVPAWTVRGHCQKALGQFADAIESYRQANRLQPTVEAWLNEALSQRELHEPRKAVECLDAAIRLAPDAPALRVARADAHGDAGRLREAVDDYKAALRMAPADEPTLKKASVCLVELNRAGEAIELCRAALKARPDLLAARLGIEWALSKLVPIWHVPMINEVERNQAYHDGLAAAVTPQTAVFEIGTGSGLLAMMAARLGAKQVVTCEAVSLIADTARAVVGRNGYADRITVVAKPSDAVRLEADLPAPADVLLHEIFSSELLGEHVLPAIEDAKRRLLKPGGAVVPASASLMIALVGGDELAKNVHVDTSFGFDLRDFNAIHPKRRPLQREDLSLLLMSEAVEAFRFDFQRDDAFPAERKRIEIRATQDGPCYGLVQWIRLEFGGGVRFENHPLHRRPISNWQHTIYGFDEPLRLTPGAVVSVDAAHDRARPWFDLIAGPR